MDYGIIGGSDGPTVIFVTGQQPGWFHPYGLVFVLMILLPHILYAVRGKGGTNLCTNRIMNLLEQIGRYGCMAAMVFDFGIGEWGFGSAAALMLYFLGNTALILAYWIFWIPYFKKPGRVLAFWLAALPGMVFVLSALTLRDIPLGILALVFCAGHMYVTMKNH